MEERITVSVAMLDARVYQYDMCGSDTLLQLEAKLHSTQSTPACSQMGELACSQRDKIGLQPGRGALA